MHHGDIKWRKHSSAALGGLGKSTWKRPLKIVTPLSVGYIAEY